MLYCYPEHMTDELLDVMAEEEKIVKYLDIPIQHCSEKVLKAMNRTGGGEALKAQLRHIREKVPGIVLRTTVMTGFPGEGREEFEELCSFIKEMRFERLGCFAFSPEEGTPAYTMEGQLSDKVKTAGVTSSWKRQSRIAAEYNEAQVGRTLEVLVEGYDRYAGCWFGRSAGRMPPISTARCFSPCPVDAPG